MRSIITIILNDLHIFFGQRGNWVSVALLPMAFTAILGWALGGAGDEVAAPTVPIDVVDLDGSPASARFMERLQVVNETFLLCPKENDSEDACRWGDRPIVPSVEQGIKRVQEGRTTALLVLSAGYDTATTTGQSTQLDYYSLEDPTVPSPILQAVQAVVQEVNGAGVAEYVGLSLVDSLASVVQDPSASIFAEPGARHAFAATLRRNLATRIGSQPALVNFNTTLPVAEDSSLQGFEQAVPGMGAAFVMLTVLAGMVTLLNERRQWTLQRIAVAPVSKAQILAGKAGAYFVIGMVQFGVVFVVGAVVGINLGGAPLALLAIMVTFVLCVTGLTFALAPHMRNEGQASGLGRLLALTLAPLGGAWWPLDIVPPFMRTVGHLSPVAWAMDAFQKIIWYNGNFGDILVEIGVLLTATAFFSVIGVLTFRVEA